VTEGGGGSKSPEKRVTSFLNGPKGMCRAGSKYSRRKIEAAAQERVGR